MARRKKEQADPDEREHSELTNVAALNDAIVNAFNELLAIDRQIDAETETHIKPLKAGRTKLLRNLKADTTIATADITAFYKLWRRQQDAIEGFVEEDDKDKVLDDMRTLFNALSTGEMLDFVDVLAERIAQEDGGEEPGHEPAHIAKGRQDAADSAAEEAKEMDASTRVH